MKKILLLAGEESGMIYANRLKAVLKDHEIRGYADYGFETGDLAVFGFWPILKKIFYFLRVKRTMEKAIDEWRPDVVLTIDYPGMNLKLAAYAKKRGIRAVHVVCPQVWAWKKGRIPKIEASLDKLCCFFPFEPALFTPGFAEFVGHPLAASAGGRGGVQSAECGVQSSECRVQSAGAEVKDSDNALSTKHSALCTTIALLPGSRIGEIEKCLPTMLEAVSKLEGVKVVIPAANEKARAAIEKIFSRPSFFKLHDSCFIQLGGARELLASASAAVVASGTATLEAALANCPTVLVYRVGALLAWFARRVIKEIKHVGLANVIWEKMRPDSGVYPMPELLQEDFTAANIEAILREWLSSEAARGEIKRRLADAVALLGSGGSPLERVAEIAHGTVK